MSTGLEIADAVAALINAGTFSVTFEPAVRQNLPVIKKENLNKTRVTCSFSAKVSDELDRVLESVQYTVGVAVAATGTRQDEAFTLVEEIQNWLGLRSNRQLTTPSGPVSLLLPFTVDPIFDARLLREEAVFLSVSLFNYLFEQPRA